jgi:hypothetical protein
VYDVQDVFVLFFSLSAIVCHCSIRTRPLAFGKILLYHKIGVLRMVQHPPVPLKPKKNFISLRKREWITIKPVLQMWNDSEYAFLLLDQICVVRWKFFHSCDAGIYGERDGLLLYGMNQVRDGLGTRSRLHGIGGSE